MGNIVGKYILLKLSQGKEKLNRSIIFELTENVAKKSHLQDG